ncbi:MAG TPA: P1 family peptidase [Pseudonocardiaceae bacterium]|nr:P1 family peptidase [Pseudonocardiaceae bacterium]
MITEVPGVLVGHADRSGPATGVTVLLTPGGAAAAVDVRGPASTRETDALDPANLVQRVQGVCLAGGGGFGLAAADGVVRWLGEQQLGFPVGAQPHEVAPIVPAATVLDLPPESWPGTPDADLGYAACAGATDGPVETGRVGAGAGGVGLGTASVSLDEAPGPDLGVVGALTVVGRDGMAGVVAVDARLTKAECRRLALAAQDGLARSAVADSARAGGVVMFALATGQRTISPAPEEWADRAAELTRLLAIDRLAAAAAGVVQAALSHIGSRSNRP